MSDYDAPYLLKLRRELYADTQKRLKRAPEMAATIQAEWEADDKVLADALTDHLKDMESLVYWSAKRDEDPIAADLMGVLLEARSDNDVWEVARDISQRFHAVAQPAPQPELSDLVAPVDRNLPFSGHRDAQRAATADPWTGPKVVRGTHDAPLGELSTRPPGFVPQVTRRNSADAYQPAPTEYDPGDDSRQNMRDSGLLKPGGHRR